MRIHRAANIKKQKHLYRIAALRSGLDIDIAIFSGFANCGVEVQFLLCPIACPFAQPFQSNLDVAGAQFNIAIKVFETALIPNLDCTPVAAFGLPNSHTFWIVTIGAKRRSAGRANPFATALMATFLLFQPFAQRLHELVKPAQSFNLCFIGFRERFFCQFAQPLIWQVHLVEHILWANVLKAFKTGCKSTVIFVKIAFILDQNRSSQQIEMLHIISCHPHFHRLQKTQELPKGHRKFMGSEVIEERQEHRLAHAQDNDIGNQCQKPADNAACGAILQHIQQFTLAFCCKRSPKNGTEGQAKICHLSFHSSK